MSPVASILLVALAARVTAVGDADILVVRPERPGGVQAPEVGQAGPVVGVGFERLAVHRHRLRLEVDAPRGRDLWQFRHSSAPLESSSPPSTFSPPPR